MGEGEDRSPAAPSPPGLEALPLAAGGRGGKAGGWHQLLPGPWPLRAFLLRWVFQGRGRIKEPVSEGPCVENSPRSGGAALRRVSGQQGLPPRAAGQCGVSASAGCLRGPGVCRAGSQPVLRPHPPEQPGPEAGSQLTVCEPCPEEEGRRPRGGDGRVGAQSAPLGVCGLMLWSSSWAPSRGAGGSGRDRATATPCAPPPSAPSLPLPILCSPEVRTAREDARQQPRSALPSGPPPSPSTECS